MENRKLNPSLKPIELIRFLNRENRFRVICVGNREDTRRFINLFNKENLEKTILYYSEDECLKNSNILRKESTLLVYLLNRNQHLINKKNINSFINILKNTSIVIYIENEKTSHFSGYKTKLLKLTDNHTSAYEILEEHCGLKGFIARSDSVNKQRLYLGGKLVLYKKTKHKPKVLAIISVYNENDIIEKNIRYLLDQGIDVHIIDNWSNDGSFEMVKRLSEENAKISFERFPREGKPKYYEWVKILHRVEGISKKSKHDWIIHYDSDEFRESPWQNVCLYDGITFVDSLGFSAIDFTILNFRYTNKSNKFSASDNPLTYFMFCEFGDDPSDFIQIKAWKNTGQTVKLAESGGHDASFKGRKVFPIKFVTRHYPLRSGRHAKKKLFSDRIPRFLPAETKVGFHSHYNRYKENKSIIFDKHNLINWNIKLFKNKYLIELISGIGLKTYIYETKEEKIQRLEKEVEEYKLILDNITSAKVFKTWQCYCQIRDRIFKK